jgi:hypothetical protein
MDLSTRFQLNGSRVIHEAFEHEAVIVNLDSGRYYCLQHAGADAWALLVAGRTLGEMATALSAQYAATIEDIAQALDRLGQELQTEGLVVTSSAGPVVSASVTTQPPLPNRKTFDPPRLQVYTDMQDLLLLDPIHEVDPAGWPVARGEDSSQPR